MLPVTDGLGENAAGALMALVPVPPSGGGRRLCARGFLIRTSLFPYSTVAGARALVDSQDTLFVLEATVVEDRACNWVHGVGSRGASSREPRVSHGCSHYAHQLGYPLLKSSTVAPESLLECLRSRGGSFFVVEFPWGRASDPAGVAPEPLEEFFDSFKGCIA